ncbi:hypothetical protein J6590_046839 [Homalodisca vitripennis]|nr:hypothetical protein J6590_046839 [Homalodisca vitripennis]
MTQPGIFIGQCVINSNDIQSANNLHYRQRSDGSHRNYSSTPPKHKSQGHSLLQHIHPASERSGFESRRSNTVIAGAHFQAESCRKRHQITALYGCAVVSVTQVTSRRTSSSDVQCKVAALLQWRIGCSDLFIRTG